MKSFHSGNPWKGHVVCSIYLILHGVYPHPVSQPWDFDRRHDFWIPEKKHLNGLPTDSLKLWWLAGHPSSSLQEVVPKKHVHKQSATDGTKLDLSIEIHGVAATLKLLKNMVPPCVFKRPVWSPRPSTRDSWRIIWRFWWNSLGKTSYPNIWRVGHRWHEISFTPEQWKRRPKRLFV